MPKTVLLFGAGKSSTVLIDFLIRECIENNWKVIVADAKKDQILLRTNNSPVTEAVEIDITENSDRKLLIERADIVISLMPPALHHLIANDCISLGKNLLTASYIDERIQEREDEINRKGLLFICEMGLDPGIDHMSAMRIIHSIISKGGDISSFKSHTGGLVAPESDDNPWHYKISWNPRNVVLAGKVGAEYKLNGKIKRKNYDEVFNHVETVTVDGLEKLAWYPNRDSLRYMPLYQLDETETFIRTTLRYSSYCAAWNAIVKADLTNDARNLDVDGLTFAKWSSKISHYVTKENKPLLEYLGLFQNEIVPQHANTSADVLQYLMETRLAMKDQDKDMIVMMHEFAYEQEEARYELKSSLVVKGEDSLRTAMAKTVGLPLGIAAKLILNGRIRLKGLHIPIDKEIYAPVLNELEVMGITFEETRRQV